MRDAYRQRQQRQIASSSHAYPLLMSHDTKVASNCVLAIFNICPTVYLYTLGFHYRFRKIQALITYQNSISISEDELAKHIHCNNGT